MPVYGSPFPKLKSEVRYKTVFERAGFDVNYEPPSTQLKKNKLNIASIHYDALLKSTKNKIRIKSQGNPNEFTFETDINPLEKSFLRLTQQDEAETPSVKSSVLETEIFNFEESPNTYSENTTPIFDSNEFSKDLDTPQNDDILAFEKYNTFQNSKFEQLTEEDTKSIKNDACSLANEFTFEAQTIESKALSSDQVRSLGPHDMEETSVSDNFEVQPISDSPESFIDNTFSSTIYFDANGSKSRHSSVVLSKEQSLDDEDVLQGVEDEKDNVSLVSSKTVDEKEALGQSTDEMESISLTSTASVDDKTITEANVSSQSYQDIETHSDNFISEDTEETRVESVLIEKEEKYEEVPTATSIQLHKLLEQLEDTKQSKRQELLKLSSGHMIAEKADATQDVEPLESKEFTSFKKSSCYLSGMPEELFAPQNEEIIEEPALKYETGEGPCRNCHQPIIPSIKIKEEKPVSASELSGQWHRKCFHCVEVGCNVQFNKNVSCYIIDDLPYCQYHYHKKNGSICKMCTNGIEGECLENDKFERFHTHCLTCFVCRETISNDYFIFNGNIPFCDKHDVNALVEHGIIEFDTTSDHQENKIHRRRTRIIGY
ncbi:hypothetical protein KAFR_0D02320 [Kazachstania africana CBS 2517]|uniref:LIM zinc-binding domain-containing protein n=1 Tax=Kazachstania africana (strain ATCC 22294 / BCRC 22015 / CBS 2517 / CECT 1963 / NBRC 1671 / NRRL Y-8276) TaxID=1071382 RepID=H2AU29_KAZAF|nr:hypothetical protein KAFR_0D02320 [Kazachstania africana CBS 2517]CCF57879.1 hypothetical protein KAFR_0D02320 [Kazachstania africana CBS 2517]